MTFCQHMYANKYNVTCFWVDGMALQFHKIRKKVFLTRRLCKYKVITINIFILHVKTKTYYSQLTANPLKCENLYVTTNGRDFCVINILQCVQMRLREKHTFKNVSNAAPKWSLHWTCRRRELI